MTKHSTKQKQNDIIVRHPSSSVSILGQCLMFQQWVDSVIADRQYVQFLSYVPKVLYCTVLYCTVLYCTVLSYVPKVLLALIIPMFDDVYHKVAVWLNDMGE